nr:aldose epimerase family protein [Polymorphobacter fuscus]
MPDGRVVEAITLTGRNGVSARIITLGATLQAFHAPDRNGRVADVTLGYDDLASYVAKPNYWGQTIGRYANRIAGAQFVLDGKTVRLDRNNGVNALHGGADGFDKRLWSVESVTPGPIARVVLALTSPAGDQGYPGKLSTRVTYALDDQGALTIDFDATSDAPTVVNMTNHALFNLAGEGGPDGTARHRLTIPAQRYTPVNAVLIPTGEQRPVAGTVFDFTRPRPLSDGLRDGRDPQIVFARGWDHNWVLDKGQTAEPGLAARLEDPESGRVLEVLTTEPGVQFYAGNFLDGSLVGKQGHLYRMGDGVALEPQKFPDTPNQPAFGSARVDPGRPYHHRMVYRVSVMP